MLSGRALTLLSVLLCVPLANLSGQVPDDLRQAIQERVEAIYGTDADAWDRLTTADFTVVLADGGLVTRDERLAQLRAGTPLPVPAVEDEHLQPYGDVVVRRIRIEDLWVLEVWVREQPGWKVSITQITQTGE